MVHISLSFLVHFTVLSQFSVMSMTMQQLKNSSKIMRKSCMPKNNVTAEQVDEIGMGKFVDDRNIKCYMACIYTMGQIIKNNKFHHEALLKQVDMMFPADMKEGAKKAVEHCKGVAKKYDDPCDVAFWTVKCVYEFDPVNFFFA